MRRLAAIIAVMGIFLTAGASAATAATCGHGKACSGTGTARLTDGLVHRRTFTLKTAREAAITFEHGWPAYVGSCRWYNRWEAACSVVFRGPIFLQASSDAVYTWTDLVARNSRFAAAVGKWGILRVGLRQVGVIRLG